MRTVCTSQVILTLLAAGFPPTFVKIQKALKWLRESAPKWEDNYTHRLAPFIATNYDASLVKQDLAHMIERVAQHTGLFAPPWIQAMFAVRCMLDANEPRNSERLSRMAKVMMEAWDEAEGCFLYLIGQRKMKDTSMNAMAVRNLCALDKQLHSAKIRSVLDMINRESIWGEGSVRKAYTIMNLLESDPSPRILKRIKDVAEEVKSGWDRNGQGNWKPDPDLPYGAPSDWPSISKRDQNYVKELYTTAIACRALAAVHRMENPYFLGEVMYLLRTDVENALQKQKRITWLLTVPLLVASAWVLLMLGPIYLGKEMVDVATYFLAVVTGVIALFQVLLPEKYREKIRETYWSAIYALHDLLFQ